MAKDGIIIQPSGHTEQKPSVDRSHVYGIEENNCTYLKYGLPILLSFNGQICKLVEWLESSVTRWLDYFFNFWPLKAMKVCRFDEMFAKVA